MFTPLQLPRNAIVNGDIVVEIAEDGKCTEFTTVPTEFTGVNNWKVEFDGAKFTVKNTVSDVTTTFRIGELKDLLKDAFKTECGNVGTVTIKDNNGNADMNEIIDEKNAPNLLVVVTVEDEGITKEYTVTYQKVSDWLAP